MAPLSRLGRKTPTQTQTNTITDKTKQEKNRGAALERSAQTASGSFKLVILDRNFYLEDIKTSCVLVIKLITDKRLDTTKPSNIISVDDRQVEARWGNSGLTYL